MRVHSNIFLGDLVYVLIKSGGCQKYAKKFVQHAVYTICRSHRCVNPDQICLSHTSEARSRHNCVEECTHEPKCILHYEDNFLTKPGKDNETKLSILCFTIVLSLFFWLSQNSELEKFVSTLHSSSFMGGGNWKWWSRNFSFAVYWLFTLPLFRYTLIP